MNYFTILVFTILLFATNTYSQYQNFADSYSILTTIAGKGALDNGGIDEWQPEYENGPATEAELSRPHFAMADAEGNVYIADKEAHAIRKVSTEGTISTVAGTNEAGNNDAAIGVDCQLNSPNGLWVKADGTVYILDLGNNKIRKLNTDGSIETVVYDTSGYSLGRGIWVTPNEDSIFYCSTSKIKLWTNKHGIKTFITGFGALANITMDNNGFLVVTDRSANLVYRISKDGSSKEVIAGNGGESGGGDGYLATETGLHGVRGVWFIEDNSYFVATHQGSQIWYIDVVGKIHLFLNGKKGDEFHTGDGEDYQTPGYKISEARSISVDHDRNIIITENDYGFIRKIQNDFTYFYSDVINKAIYKGFTITPNPANKKIRLDFQPNTNKIKTIEIYNVCGQKVLSKEQAFSFNPIELDVSAFKSGIYFVVLKNENNYYSDKLIIR